MKAMWMALLTVVMMTGCGAREEQPSHVAAQWQHLTTTHQGVLAAGAVHSLALNADGTVWAWGDNPWGQLGDGTQRSRYNPAPVPGLTGVLGITASTNTSLVVRRDGTVWGFGSNGQRLMADAEQPLYLTPVQRPELTGVMALSSSNQTGLALREDGTVWSWGGNVYDQIGDGVSSLHTTPARVLLPCRFTAMPSRDHRASEAKHCPALP